MTHYCTQLCNKKFDLQYLKKTRDHWSWKSATSTEGCLLLDQLPSQEINYEYHGIARIIFEMRVLGSNTFAVKIRQILTSKDGPHAENFLKKYIMAVDP